MATKLATHASSSALPLSSTRRSVQCGCCSTTRPQPLIQPAHLHAHGSSTGHTSSSCRQHSEAPLGVQRLASPNEESRAPSVSHPTARLLASLAALLVTVWPAPVLAAPVSIDETAQPSPAVSSATTLAAASPAESQPAPSLAAPSSPDAPTPGKYVPSPYQPGWEVWVGFFAGVIPFAIGSWEFGKRIIIQRRCALCAGRGLVPSSKPGSQNLRKCPECGGFFPWISWKMFLTSTAAPGNGGPLQQPRGQSSVFYSVPDNPTPEDFAKMQARYFDKAAYYKGEEEEKQDNGMQ